MAKKKVKKERKISHASARRKGHQFERNVAIKLRRVFPEACRQLEYQLNQCKGVDLANTGEYLFQLKKLQKYASITCIEEIQIDDFDKDSGVVPVLVTAGDNKEPMAVLPFEKLVDLLHIEKLYRHEAEQTIARSKRHRTYGE